MVKAQSTSSLTEHLTSDLPNPASALDGEESRQLFGEYLNGKGIQTHTLAHEYEAGLTSRRAMEITLGNSKVLELFEETGKLFDAPGDRLPALAAHMCGLPALETQAMTKDFAKAEMSLVGGQYFHIHYVNWEDELFTEMVDAILKGTRTALSSEFIGSMMGRTVLFGRCVGVPLNELVLRPDGSLGGSRHGNEARWRVAGDALLFTDGNGAPTTIFHTVVTHGKRLWVIGPVVREAKWHFLRVD